MPDRLTGGTATTPPAGAFPDLVDAIAVLDRRIDEIGNYHEGEAWATVRAQLQRRAHGDAAPTDDTTPGEVYAVHAGALALALHDTDCGCDNYDQVEAPRYIDAVRSVLDARDVTPRSTILAAESVVGNMLMTAAEDSSSTELARAIVAEVRQVLPTPIAWPAPTDDTAPAPDGKIRAPFTDAQQSALTRWQNEPAVHAFTCPNDGASLTVGRHWYCMECDYTQYWAHEFMADPQALARFHDALRAGAAVPPETAPRGRRVSVAEALDIADQALTENEARRGLAEREAGSAPVPDPTEEDAREQ